MTGPEHSGAHARRNTFMAGGRSSFNASKKKYPNRSLPGTLRCVCGLLELENLPPKTNKQKHIKQQELNSCGIPKSPGATGSHTWWAFPGPAPHRTTSPRWGTLLVSPLQSTSSDFNLRQGAHQWPPVWRLIFYSFFSPAAYPYRAGAPGWNSLEFLDGRRLVSIMWRCEWSGHQNLSSFT